MKHLDDIILQQYLEEGNSVFSPQQMEHLKKCEYCQKRVSLYQDIFQSLQSMGNEALLPHHFDIQVMHRISDVSTGFNSWLEVVITIVGAIGGILLTLFYYPENGIRSIAEKFIFNLIGGFQEFIQEGYMLLQKSGLSPLWLIAILLGAGMIILLDQIFVRSRFQSTDFEQ